MRSPRRTSLAIRPRTPTPRSGYARLVTAIASTSRDLVGRAVSAVNQALVIRNGLVGAHIVEYEQQGRDRAKYGARLLERLAHDLSARGVIGLNVRTLQNCRLLYLTYPQIRQPVAAEFRRLPGPTTIRQPVAAEFDRTPASTPPTPLDAATLLRLTWSHLVELLAIDDPWKRAFYENACLEGTWSKRQLQRQIESLLYERTALSRNKRAVMRRANGHTARDTVADHIRDPYVLEFTGLAERAEYSEGDLETALLDHLQRFLLELGTGFCFEARQFRITLSNKHDRVDLVFYHRLLRCHVLVDLKIRAFRHADAGQMNFYVNWFKTHMMARDDRPPVGIILCSDRNRTEVEFATAGMENRLFVSRYLTVLPSADQLRTLIERDRARLEAPARRKARTIK